MNLFKSIRPKSALMRDRAYKSDEPHEQNYERKTKPKNPRYDVYAKGGSLYNAGGIIADAVSFLNKKVTLADFNF